MFSMTSAGSEWEKVDGGLSLISSGADGEVWGIMNEKIFKREGVSKEKPTGTACRQVIGSLVQQDVFGGEVWGVNSQHQIFHTEIKGKKKSIASKKNY